MTNQECIDILKEELKLATLNKPFVSLRVTENGLWSAIDHAIRVLESLPDSENGETCGTCNIREIPCDDETMSLAEMNEVIKRHERILSNLNVESESKVVVSGDECKVFITKVHASPGCDFNLSVSHMVDFLKRYCTTDIICRHDLVTNCYAIRVKCTQSQYDDFKMYVRAYFPNITVEF